MSNFSSHRTAARPIARAFTLVELMIALSIFSMVAMASTSLLVSTLHVQTYVKASAATSAQVELLISRVTDNTRSASAVTVTASSIQVTTPPDASNNIYNVTYSLSHGQVIEVYVNASTSQVLTDSAMVSNVTSFSVATLSGNPKAFQITISAGSGVVVQRTFVVFGRNL